MKYLPILLLIGFFRMPLSVKAQNMLSEITEKTPYLPFDAMGQQLLQYGEQLRHPQLPQAQQKLIIQYNILNKEYQDSIDAYIKNDPKTEKAAILSLHYFFDIRKDSSFLRKNLISFRSAGTHNKYTTYIQEELNGLDSGQIGKSIPSFAFRNLEGKIQDFPNKQKTLLVFWASWCAPCRLETDHLKAQYTQIVAKGIAVASINLDEDLQKWLWASKQDQIPWVNCYADGSWGSRVARFFTLHQIPQNVLLDGNGIILAKNLSINQLLK